MAAGLLPSLRHGCHHVERNVITYSSALSACEKGCRWEFSLHVFREMVMAGVERNKIAFKSAIYACERGSNWPSALRLLSETEVVTDVDPISYSVAIFAGETAGALPQAISSLRLIKA